MVLQSVSLPYWVLQVHGCSKPHLKLLMRHLHFSPDREPRHPVKTIKSTVAISMPHEVPVRVLLNKTSDRYSEHTFQNDVDQHRLLAIVSPQISTGCVGQMTQKQTRRQVEIYMKFVCDMPSSSVLH